MDLFVVLKLVHVVAAITAVGSNLTYGFWMRRVGSADRDRLIWTIQGIRALDRRIANPAYGLVLLTGLAMVVSGGFSFAAAWLSTAIVLYAAAVVIGIVVYAPAIRRQLAAAEVDPGSEAYRRAAATTTTLGLVTTAIVLVIIFLMVVKPG